MVTFGKQFDREQFEKAAEGGDYANTIWSFRTGSTVVRFLDDLANDEWTSYWEHYDAGRKKYYPCPGQAICPGCKDGLKASRKYLTNLLVVSADDEKVKPGYVNLYKMPVSIMNKALRRVDRHGTIRDRDYEIIRVGSGMDTEYDLETGDKYPVDDLATHETHKTDHEPALQAAFEAAFPDFDPDGGSQERVEKRAPKVDKPEPKTIRERVQDKVDAKAQDAGDPPSEPQVQSESADAEGDDEIISEAAIREMSVEQLASLYKRAGIELPPTVADEDEAKFLADYLIDQLAE